MEHVRGMGWGVVQEEAIKDSFCQSYQSSPGLSQTAWGTQATNTAG